MLSYSIDQHKWNVIYFSGIPPKLANTASMIWENLFLTFGGTAVNSKGEIVGTNDIFYYDLIGSQNGIFAWESLFKKDKSFNLHFLFN